MSHIVCINHHLYQEGDAYGLIYALLLNMAQPVGEIELHALFYIDGDSYDTDAGYRAQVERRLGYFRSFDLLGRRVKLVFCRFHPDPHVFSLKVRVIGPAAMEVVGNAGVFKRNPRKVSLALTEAENDVGKEILTLRKDVFEEDAEKFVRGLNQLFSAELQLRSQFGGVGGGQVDSIKFRYISYSTDYILRCTNVVGFEHVSGTLIGAVLGATSTYTPGNERFLQAFMERLLKRKLGSTAEPAQTPLIILFWIRGAKESEQQAIGGDRSKSVGKPQHHTNHTLYKQVRALAGMLGETLRRKVLFVPIGDELKETGFREEFNFKKQAKDYNLIEFFRREGFAGKPMGAQMNFLTLMAMRYPVVQVGMRSGSMERLMYLGVPTVYFDRTRVEEGLPPLVGATRIRQLCGLQGTSALELKDYLLQLTDYLGKEQPWKKGFPYFFHIENRDTGFLRYSMHQTSLDRAVETLISTRRAPDGTPYTRSGFNLIKSLAMKSHLRDLSLELRQWLLTLGGLENTEAERLALILWFIDQTYPNYVSRRRIHSDTRVRLRLDDFGRHLIARRDERNAEIQRKQQARLERRQALDKEEEIPWNLFGGEPEL